MRDIPVFTTENGVASLTLKEIPYCGDAYVRILDSAAPDLFVKECADFCYMAGARTVYLSGKNVPEQYPVFTETWQMEQLRQLLPKNTCSVISVDASNMNFWRDVYNDRMVDVPTAAFMSKERAEQLLQSENAYFVYKDSQLLGIGAVSGGDLACIASVVPGAGIEVLCALACVATEDTLRLEVASENKRAISLYKRLGFEKTAVNEIWHKYVPK